MKGLKKSEPQHVRPWYFRRETEKLLQVERAPWFHEDENIVVDSFDLQDTDDIRVRQPLAVGLVDMFRRIFDYFHSHMVI